MNLKEIRTRMQNLSDFKPTNQDHLDDMDALINMAYEYVWLSRPWSFAQKLQYLNVYPDLNYTITGKNASVSDYSRRVTFSGSIRSLTSDIYVGQIFECQGREYKILKVVSDTEIRLVEAFRGTTNTDDTTWILKTKYYNLPQDLVQIASLSHRDAPMIAGRRAPLIGVASRKEEDLALQENLTAAFADYYIHVPPTVLPSGEKLKNTGATAITVGDLAANSYYEFAWCYRYKNMLGPLSDPLTAQALTAEGGTKPVINLRTVTHDDVTIKAAAFNTLQDKVINPWEGPEKILWVNVNYDHVNNKRLGLPKWCMVTKASLVATQYDHEAKALTDEESDWSINVLASLSPGNPQYIEVDGHHHMIRPYPRINGYDAKYEYSVDGSSIVHPEEYFRQLELRYLYKPKSLLSITDTPEMPYEMHDLIVYKALEDYYMKKGNTQLSQVFRGRYEMDLKAAEMKYVERADVKHQRSFQFGVGRGTIPFASTAIKRSSF